ncbi:hypothetical protein RRU94_15730 [Domibacillus sp. DTU_2020_1001157_1_SI_ALB_TIR_016]|uniref:hypothetical protein n=1 Tax=Domibacillus sp. DTU_2020_1001157_1_SI_ALB_TIR_016 TaxID=3077789 RepID=UPI0028E6CC07|nr:hypothetical protein [Domibacillus sp. DTU_2020_1001157_1_SI_ALB_TIR_016]WNS82196.1 hypothetical protein RRU94_15730 [Domibacillus sp. DTU_2020_1001157_1_SI_ALB_TIR_016]
MGTQTSTIETILKLAKTRIENELDLSHVDNGVRFEEYVAETLTEECEAHYSKTGEIITVEQTGAQSFPDIILGSTFGVEVKYTKSNKWQSMGNSIFEGTFRKEVTDQIYTFFGRKSGNKIEARWRKYEDSLSEIKVTHSPRFLIDMEINQEDTVLRRIDISYQDFKVLSQKEKAKRLKEFVKSTLREGETLWWLDETEDEGFSPKIKDFRDLTSSQRSRYLIEAMVLFPEVFSNESSKYLNTSLYFLKEHQLISSSLRDSFSAGGREALLISGETVNVPQAYKKLYDSAEGILYLFKTIDLGKLLEYWEEKGVREIKTRNEAIRTWFRLLNRYSANLPAEVKASTIFKAGLK